MCRSQTVSLVHFGRTSPVHIGRRCLVQLGRTALVHYRTADDMQRLLVATQGQVDIAQVTGDRCPVAVVGAQRQGLLVGGQRLVVATQSFVYRPHPVGPPRRAGV